MKTYYRICALDYKRNEGELTAELVKGKSYLTSDTHDDATVTVFTPVWFRVPVAYFEDNPEALCDSCFPWWWQSKRALDEKRENFPVMNSTDSLTNPLDETPRTDAGNILICAISILEHNNSVAKYVGLQLRAAVHNLERENATLCAERNAANQCIQQAHYNLKKWIESDEAKSLGGILADLSVAAVAYSTKKNQL